MLGYVAYNSLYLITTSYCVFFVTFCLTNIQKTADNRKNTFVQNKDTDGFLRNFHFQVMMIHSWNAFQKFK